MKQTIIRLSFLLIGIGLIISSTHAQTPQTQWLVQSARVLDFNLGKFTQPMDVLVNNGEIVALGKRLNAPNVPVIEANGLFLIPGFTEMHAHVPPGDINNEALKRILFLYTAYGITTIRGMLGHPDHLRLRKALADNKLLGPRLITSGPSLNGKSVSSAGQAAKKVRLQQQAGYDFLKIHPGLTAKEFTAIAHQANALNLPFAGHITETIGIFGSIQSGQATIDHLDGVMQELAKRSKQSSDNALFFGVGLINKIDDEHIKPLAQELAKTGVAMVPTETIMPGFLSPEPAAKTAQASIYTLMPKTTLEGWKRSRTSMQKSPGYSAEKVERFLNIRKKFLKAFVDAGGLLLIGSDAPQVFNVPGDSIHKEMVTMSEAGISNLAILKAATLEPAKFFGRSGKLGSIVPGKAADFILLSANPLKDISNTRQIKGVMSRGQWLSQSEIQTRLEKIRQSH